MLAVVQLWARIASAAEVRSGRCGHQLVGYMLAARRAQRLPGLAGLPSPLPHSTRCRCRWSSCHSCRTCRKS